MESVNTVLRRRQSASSFAVRQNSCKLGFELEKAVADGMNWDCSTSFHEMKTCGGGRKMNAVKPVFPLPVRRSLGVCVRDSSGKCGEPQLERIARPPLAGGNALKIKYCLKLCSKKNV